MREVFRSGLIALAASTATAYSFTPDWFSQETWSGLTRRADNSSNITIPAAISIAPSQYWDGNDGPWSSFPIQLGQGYNTQNVRVMVSTAAYNTWVIGADKGCPSGLAPDCANQRGFLYAPNQSLTWVPNSAYNTVIESNLGLGTSALAGYETITLGWQGSGGPTVGHSVLFQVYWQKYWLGLFGLNPQPTNFTSLNSPQSSYMQSLYDTKTIPSRSYGYTAGNQYRKNKVFGSLTLGGYDANRFSSAGSLSWPFYADTSRDLLVGIDSISTNATVNGGASRALLPGGHINAYVDSTVPHIWLPTSACSAFESAFNLTYNDTVNLYIVDGDTHNSLLNYNPTVTLTLSNGNGTMQIALPYSAFDLNVSQPIVSTSSYYFPLQRAANDTQYTLGRTFLQEAYLIADYDRSNFTIAPCSWDNVQSTSVKSILSPSLAAAAASQSAAATSSNKGISAGVIAGIVVAVVVGFILIALVAFFLIRRKKQNRERQAVYEKDGTAIEDTQSDTPVQARAKTTDDVQPASELHSSHVTELAAPHRDKPQEMPSPFKPHPSDRVVEMGSEEDCLRRRHEMGGDAPIYEMQGSDIPEIYTQPPQEKSRREKQ